MQKKLLTAGISGGLFLLLILLLRTVDIQAVGPAGTSVGLASLNNGFHTGIGVHPFWSTVSNILGIIAIASAAGWALLGALPLIREKSLKKADPNLILLGILFLVTILIYLFFNLVTVNARPVLMKNETVPEASFPSSHVMMILVAMLGSIKMLNHYVRNLEQRRLFQLICWFVLIFSVFARMLSGVHWFTDIIGGILIAICLFSLFSIALQYIRQLQKEDRLPFFE